jgi:cytochrome c2
MPNFHLNEEQAALLVNALLAGSRSHISDVRAPVTVHFSNATVKNVDVFSRACGFCHSVLSERRGALGTANTGPNLSGLLSVNYPKTFRFNDSWTVHNLSSWLKNPREVRLSARMRPIELTDVEYKELISILQITSGTVDAMP